KDEQLPNNMGWWLTVGTPEEPNGAELLLEPARGWEPAKVYYEALYNSGIPVTALKSDDLRKEYEELKNKGVVFRGEPAEFAGSLSVMFDDTCGNLLQLYQVL